MIKNIFRKLLYGYKATSSAYEKHLRSCGVHIGKNFRIYLPTETIIDTQNPYMLKIGDNVALTGPVTIMTHDYSWKVFKNMDGRILGNQQPVLIGNNIFIGWGATILGGAIIEDNVIIGAGSLVTSHCEKNSVYAGIPAKRIMSVEEFMRKRASKQIEEAKTIREYYRNKYHKNPDIRLFNSYFPIFTSKDNFYDITNTFEDRLNLENCKELSIKYLKESNSNYYSSFEDFLNDK